MFTKGEWTIQASHSSAGIPIVTNDRKIAYVTLKKESSSWGDAAMFKPDNAECLANARLIACSPRLYEACKDALHTLDTMTSRDFELGRDAPVRKQLSEALALVEGK